MLNNDKYQVLGYLTTPDHYFGFYSVRWIPPPNSTTGTSWNVSDIRYMNRGMV